MSPPSGVRGRCVSRERDRVVDDRRPFLYPHVDESGMSATDRLNVGWER
ncbi:hypothetical protein [Halorubrum sp. DTA98]